jgi:hypothetical protein
MKQHPIDLLPTSIRLRNQAGARAGRYLAILVAAVALVIVLATHSRFQLNHAETVLHRTEIEADQVLEAEERASGLRRALKAGNEAMKNYRQLAHPLDVSAVIATVVNQMPEGATLDRIDLDAGARRIIRSARSKGPVDLDEVPRRMLTAEIAGFALSDLQVAEIVATLESIEPLRDVSLDFSRTRAVRGRAAREFRLSFRIDLDADYEVDELNRPLAAAEEEAGDVE